MLKLLSLSLGLALTPLTPAAAQEDEPVQSNERIEITEERALDYLLSIPAVHDADGEPVPVILFLHGAGERGDDLDRVKAWGPPRMVESGHDFGAIVVSPQCPAGSWWTDHLRTLEALLDHIEATYNVDADRIYVTGLSMGGYGTFALGARNPERYAALVPICGGGLYFDAMRVSATPMWVFHGEDDRVVPLEESQRMVRIANSRNGEHAQLTTYPGVGHDSWKQAYADEAMWEWMFEQGRR
ncbi:prolyl oligopeptidase family serine peptidase [Phycisphaeraceae bacterium D3-23]